MKSKNTTIKIVSNTPSEAEVTTQIKNVDRYLCYSKMSLLFASFIKNSIDRTKQGMNNEPLSRDKVQKFLKFLNQINLDTLLCNAKLDFWFFGADITKFIMIYRLHNQAPSTEQNKNVFNKYIKDLALQFGLKYAVISLQNHFCQKQLILQMI